MLSLLVMEIRRLRDHLLMSAGMLAAVAIVLGRADGSPFVLTMFAVLPVVSGMVVPINSFMQEERGNALVFMRSLPLRPWEIVAAKYGATYISVLALGLALLVASPILPNLAMPRILRQVSCVTALSLVFSAMSYFLLFLFGLKRGRIIGMAIYLGSIVLWALAHQRAWGSTVLVAEGYERLMELASTPLGPILAVAVGTCVVVVSYAASARIFSARDISRMP